MSAPYRVVLLDADDCELSVTEENTLREARRSALEKTREPCNSDWRVAQVRCAEGDVVWDRRAREECPNCGEELAPGQERCCTDDFPEAGDIRETGR